MDQTSASGYRIPVNPFMGGSLKRARLPAHLPSVLRILLTQGELCHCKVQPSVYPGAASPRLRSSWERVGVTLGHRMTILSDLGITAELYWPALAPSWPTVGFSWDTLARRRDIEGYLATIFG